MSPAPPPPAEPLRTLVALLCAGTLSAQEPPQSLILAGQELIYRGRFGAAQLYFARLAEQYPGAASAPALQASALIWWAEARDEETWNADSIDVLLDSAIARARTGLDSARSDSARVSALFWLGTAYGYKARQSELRNALWRASREARAMQQHLERALALDTTCADCLLGLGVYDYALARAGTLARFIARLVGLGSGDAARSLDRMRAAAEHGTYARWEARWVLANALIREGERDASLREEGRRIIAELATQFPENPVFRRQAASTADP